MRAFVLEVSSMKNIQHDMISILQRVNDKRQENKKVAFDNLHFKMEKGLKDSLIGAYKKWSNQDIGVDINEVYISPKIREKWRSVCEYYNQYAQ